MLKKITYLLFLIIIGIGLYFSFEDTYKKETKANKLLEKSFDFNQQVAKIVIENSNTSFNILKKDNNWILPNYDSYPASKSKIYNFFANIEALKLLDKKTNDGKYHEKLGLEYPFKKNSNGERISLVDQNNQTIFSFILGNAIEKGNNKKYRYIRKDDTSQAWIYTDNLNLFSNEIEWGNNNILNIARWRVKSVTTKDFLKKNNNIKVFRDSFEKSTYNLEDVPNGFELKSSYALNSLAAALENVEIIDIKYKSNLKKYKLIREIKYTMFDGLELLFSIYDIKNTKYLNIKSFFRKEERKPLKKDTEEKIIGLPTLFTSSEVVKEVESYNYLNAWLYKIDENTIKEFSTNKEDLILSKSD